MTLLFHHAYLDSIYQPPFLLLLIFVLLVLQVVQFQAVHEHELTIVRQLNEQVAEDDVTNMNRQSADDSNDESHKMTSWPLQIMSQ